MTEPVPGFLPGAQRFATYSGYKSADADNDGTVTADEQAAHDARAREMDADESGDISARELMLYALNHQDMFTQHVESLTRAKIDRIAPEDDASTSSVNEADDVTTAELQNVTVLTKEARVVRARLGLYEAFSEDTINEIDGIINGQEPDGQIDDRELLVWTLGTYASDPDSLPHQTRALIQNALGVHGTDINALIVMVKEEPELVQQALNRILPPYDEYNQPIVAPPNRRAGNSSSVQHPTRVGFDQNDSTTMPWINRGFRMLPYVGRRGDRGYSSGTISLPDNTRYLVSEVAIIEKTDQGYTVVQVLGDDVTIADPENPGETIRVTARMTLTEEQFNEIAPENNRAIIDDSIPLSELRGPLPKRRIRSLDTRQLLIRNGTMYQLDDGRVVALTDDNQFVVVRDSNGQPVENGEVMTLEEIQEAHIDQVLAFDLDGFYDDLCAQGMKCKRSAFMALFGQGSETRTVGGRPMTEISWSLFCQNMTYFYSRYENNPHEIDAIANGAHVYGVTTLLDGMDHDPNRQGVYSLPSTWLTSEGYLTSDAVSKLGMPGLNIMHRVEEIVNLEHQRFEEMQEAGLIPAGVTYDAEARTAYWADVLLLNQSCNVMASTASGVSSAEVMAMAYHPQTRESFLVLYHALLGSPNSTVSESDLQELDNIIDRDTRERRFNNLFDRSGDGGRLGGLREKISNWIDSHRE